MQDVYDGMIDNDEVWFEYAPNCATLVLDTSLLDC